MEIDRTASIESILKIKNEYSNVFTGIGCFNYILLKLLKLDMKLSCLSLVCQFDRYKFFRLSFGVVLVGDMFQQKIDKIVKDLPNLFVIADDI